VTGSHPAVIVTTSERAAMATDPASQRNQTLELETLHRRRAKLLRAAIGPGTSQHQRR